LLGKCLHSISHDFYFGVTKFFEKNDYVGLRRRRLILFTSCHSLCQEGAWPREDPIYACMRYADPSTSPPTYFLQLHCSIT